MQRQVISPPAGSLIPASDTTSQSRHSWERLPIAGCDEVIRQRNGGTLPVSLSSARSFAIKRGYDFPTWAILHFSALRFFCRLGGQRKVSAMIADAVPSFDLHAAWKSTPDNVVRGVRCSNAQSRQRTAKIGNHPSIWQLPADTGPILDCNFPVRSSVVCHWMVTQTKSKSIRPSTLPWGLSNDRIDSAAFACWGSNLRVIRWETTQ